MTRTVHSEALCVGSIRNNLVTFNGILGEKVKQTSAMLESKKRNKFAFWLKNSAKADSVIRHHKAASKRCARLIRVLDYMASSIKRLRGSVSIIWLVNSNGIRTVEKGKPRCL